ncbi:PREDICTED: cytochrome P450 CYP82D47-like [Ipomoea nil]|uniref:cytochrome P450 CYP82D47-like n=1 Tax=Ipomoea nil TaxID=35883 RepID=UPI000900E757|nr:PREDICTED: cytochrome P450 CYP82D47-like [Ipomoea nil]
MFINCGVMLIFCVSKAMEFPSLLYDNIIITPTLACTLLLILFFMCKLFLAPKNDAQHKRLAPEVPRAWPIIGHLHLLAGQKTPTHLILAAMADKYGPIFRMRLGSQPVVVVSDSIVAKECFKAKDKELATRPKFMAAEIMGYNYSMFSLAPYGEYWREIRKIVLLELLSTRRIEMLRKVRESHVRKAIKRTFDHWSHNKDPISGAVVVEMRQWFSRLILNLSIAMLFGEEEVAEESQLLKSIRRLFELFGELPVSDFIPWLRWMDLGGYEKAMRKTAEEMDCAADRWLKEHRTKRNLKSKEEEDFMDAMLSLFDDPSNQTHPLGFDNDVIIKSTCLNLLLAATDTTSVTLIWALSLVLNNYDVLRNIQEELDTKIGKSRGIEESDINQLTYIQAVVKETFRLHPAAPLSVPHEAIQDCTINGYHIHKGTRVIPNFARIHRDPKVWVKPNEFWPERFLTTHKDIDVKGNHFEIIPFGSGRRVCPGITLGLQMVHLTLASLIQSFDMKRPSKEPIDMTQSPGLTSLKATPLYVHLIPRLDSDLYG